MIDTLLRQLQHLLNGSFLRESSSGVQGNELGAGRTENGKSILNKYGRNLDSRNLFVNDACCLVSSPCQNIALLMLAQVFVIPVLCRAPVKRHGI
jgi:hypothetical protein